MPSTFIDLPFLPVDEMSNVPPIMVRLPVTLIPWHFFESAGSSGGKYSPPVQCMFTFTGATVSSTYMSVSVVMPLLPSPVTSSFIVPPFSVLDTRQGYWQDRKRIWKKIIKSDEGREEGLLGSGLLELAQKHGSTLTGTSIFDPVLCEILVNWFCPVGGKVLDPFAGGSVRGLISVLLGNDYTGIDLREEQIQANYKNYREIADRQDLLGGDLKKPQWITDDSRNIDLLVKEKHDFLLTCPPYADLEVYSDDPRDISNMPYNEFKEAYFEIIKKACDKLKDNAFAAIVVGEVRDKQGYYYNFIGDTIKAFEEAGLKYYNEIILLNAIATAALRAKLVFNGGRKVVKTHQNVLVFVKGDEKEVVQSLEKYEYDFDENATE